MSVMRWANLTPLKTACHSEPFACHSERSEESPQLAQGRLREGSQQLLLVQLLTKNCRDASPAGRDQHDRVEFLHTLSGTGTPARDAAAQLWYKITMRG